MDCGSIGKIFSFINNVIPRQLLLFLMSAKLIEYLNYLYFINRDVHNAYGHVNVMATHAGHLARSNNEQRPFVLSRSGFAGTQR
jgi:hypothetical protein